MKKIITVLTLLFSINGFAGTDYNCVSDCTARGYMYNLCTEKCSYDIGGNSSEGRMNSNIILQQKPLNFGQRFQEGRRARLQEEEYARRAKLEEDEYARRARLEEDEHARNIIRQEEQDARLGRQDEREIKLTDDKCLNECTSEGYMYGFCKNRCSY